MYKGQYPPQPELWILIRYAPLLLLLLFLLPCAVARLVGGQHDAALCINPCVVACSEPFRQSVTQHYVTSQIGFILMVPPSLGFQNIPYLDVLRYHHETCCSETVAFSLGGLSQILCEDAEVARLTNLVGGHCIWGWGGVSGKPGFHSTSLCFPHLCETYLTELT